MSEIFLPEQGDEVVLETIDLVTLSHDLKEIDDLSEFNSFEESDFTDAVLKKDEGQTVLHVLTFINHLSRVEKLMFPYLEGKGIKFIKVALKIMLESILKFR